MRHFKNIKDHICEQIENIFKAFVQPAPLEKGGVRV